jgi:hypothetical protein
VRDESFADHPRSLTELKAARAWDGRLWTPRDALIDLLRDIDAGKIEISDLIIAYRQTDGTHRFSGAGPGGQLTILGLLSRATAMVNAD